LLVRDEATDRSGTRGSELDGGAGNREMLRIGDGAGEDGVVALAKGRQRQREEKWKYAGSPHVICPFKKTHAQQRA